AQTKKCCTRQAAVLDQQKCGTRAPKVAPQCQLSGTFGAAAPKMALWRHHLHPRSIIDGRENFFDNPKI
ncbi:hypothetical protein TorRG33x02_184230, partial [Trema orientale]